MNKKIIWGIVIGVVVLVVAMLGLKTAAFMACYSDNPLDKKSCYYSEKFPYFHKNSKVDSSVVSTADWKTYTRAGKYKFSYPSYAEIEETNGNGVITDTTMVLTPDWNNVFDVTTHPEAIFCESNPYKDNPYIKVIEDRVTKYENEYRHLSVIDSSAAENTKEDRYYIFKNNTCYMIVLKTSGKDIAIINDVEKIFSTFKFSN